MTYPHTQLFINGQWCDAEGGRTLPVFNPATGTDNGRDIRHRQVLRLIPGPRRAEALQDPLTGDWFCRVRWQAQDALRSRYCFTLDCGAAPQVDACLFHGNLVDMGHGRPRRTVFTPPGAPLPATGDTQLVARSALRLSDNANDNESKLEPVFTDLVGSHSKRMDALGLTA